MKYYLAFLVFCCTWPVSLTQAGIFNAQSTILDNGLTVVVIPNHRAPIIHHMLWYKAGSAQEINGYSGVAHFLEHLLFKGTDHPKRPLKAGEFSKRIRQMGGQDNAFTSKDTTGFYQTVSKEHLRTVMQMEADRMRHSMPPEKDVLSERDVVVEERNQRTENNPHARFQEQLQATLFPGHPYGRPVIGWRDEIPKMNQETTRAFYNQWYHPNNAILIITGDITLEDILSDIKDIYGVLEKQPLPVRHFPVIPAFEGQVTITHHDAQVEEPRWVRGYQVPSFRQNKKQALALQVLENILDGGATTRLYKKLVVEEKKAINISLSYRPDSYDTSSLWISAIPAQGISLDVLEKEIEALLLTLIEEGVNDKELSDAKTRLKNAAIFARDSLSTPAHIIGYALTTGATLKDVETWDIQIDAVTKEQIQSVADMFLNPLEKDRYNNVTGYLLPKEESQE